MYKIVKKYLDDIIKNDVMNDYKNEKYEYMNIKEMDKKILHYIYIKTNKKEYYIIMYPCNPYDRYHKFGENECLLHIYDKQNLISIAINQNYEFQRKYFMDVEDKIRRIEINYETNNFINEILDILKTGNDIVEYKNVSV